MYERVDLRDRARGKWKSILVALGIPESILTTKGSPCPMCGGKDRFSWSDKDSTGNYFCHGCGPGSAVTLVMKVKGVNFTEAVRLIEGTLGVAKFSPPKADRSTPEEKVERMAALWRKARKLDGNDPASKYLISRGITKMPHWSAVRCLMETEHYAGRIKSIMPAMLSRFVAPDGRSDTSMLHVTYLTINGAKADFGDSPNKKFMPGFVPAGGAIRLFEAEGDTLGVAEGVETALSASQMFNIPVWACTSTVCLLKWLPPNHIKRVVIFADTDANFAGMCAAANLANKLSLHPISMPEVKVMMLTPSMGVSEFIGGSDVAAKADFNDRLQREIENGRPSATATAA